MHILILYQTLMEVLKSKKIATTLKNVWFKHGGQHGCTDWTINIRKKVHGT
jgi:hypothetical protein